MRRSIPFFAVLIAATSFAPSPSSAAPGRTAKPGPEASLCKPGETVITSCHSKGLTFSLCGMNGPKQTYVVYREARKAGPVRQVPEDPARYAEEFHYSFQGTSAWEERVRFTMDGAPHYIVSAMAKVGIEFDRYGWPANATALIVKDAGRTRQYNCRWSDAAAINQSGWDLIPKEDFDNDLRPGP